MEVYKALSVLSVNSDFYQWKMLEKLNQSLCLVSGMLLAPLQFCILKHSGMHCTVQNSSVLGKPKSNMKAVVVLNLLLLFFFPCLCFPAMFGLLLFWGAFLGLVF